MTLPGRRLTGFRAGPTRSGSRGWSRHGGKVFLALLLVGIGRLLSPDAVPIYDGLGADEPYRYVSKPEGAPNTAEPTTAAATTPVKQGRSTAGLTARTDEVGPQLSLYLPPGALASSASTITVEALPKAPHDAPPARRIDGNVYEVRLTAAQPVTLTSLARVATLYMRATTAQQPPPVMHYRSAPALPWTDLQTNRAGQDIYAVIFAGPGEYALSFDALSDGGTSRLPLLLSGALAAVIACVVMLRLRRRE